MKTKKTQQEIINYSQNIWLFNISIWLIIPLYILPVSHRKVGLCNLSKLYYHHSFNMHDIIISNGCLDSSILPKP